MRTGRHLRRPLVLVALLAAVLAGCGSKQSAYTTVSNTSLTGEATYLAAGGLTYQIQLSRELNPSLIQDRTYLAGVPRSAGRPSADEEWFGIWLRVENPRSRPIRSTGGFYLIDTLGNRYYPVPMPASNVLAYQAQTIPPHTTIPSEDSLAYRSDTQGELVLFKINISAYQNRPVTLHILAADGSGITEATALVDL
jgi:hypothetical protein